MPSRTSLLRLAALASAALVLTPQAIAQQATPPAMPATIIRLGVQGRYREAVAHILADAVAAMDRQHTPGMALALTDRKGTISILTLGDADLEHRTPVTPATRFGIGSITKSMTALALLEARDRGRFEPHAPVTRYLPWFAVRTRWRPITGHDLLTHTSGLPDGGLGYGAPYDVALLRELQTGFAPGTHWSYSNIGFETLGSIVAAIDHRSWSEVVQRGVLGPIGMTSSAPDWTFETLRSAATGYLPREDDRLPDPRQWDLARVPLSEFSDAAGSVLSTPGDMARYARVILNGGVVVETGKRLISPASYRLLTTAATTAGTHIAPGLYETYAYGLAVHTLDGDRVVGHTGGTTPYTACLEADLTAGFAAVALTNVGALAERPCPIVEQALRVLRSAAHGTPFPTLPPAPDPAHVAHAAAFAGTYRPLGSAAALTVVAEGDHIALAAPGMQHPLLPVGGGVYWTDDPRARLHAVRFIIDPRTHHVDRLVVDDRWYASEAYRGPRVFPHPARWDAYAGHYRYPGGHPYDTALRVQLIEGALSLDDGTPLVPLADGSFRIGEERWNPERLRFDTLVEGHAQRATWSGVALYRVTTP
jgi:CubicO group peptidase (beta-lactamase class C family)